MAKRNLSPSRRRYRVGFGVSGFSGFWDILV